MEMKMERKSPGVINAAEGAAPTTFDDTSGAASNDVGAGGVKLTLATVGSLATAAFGRALNDTDGRALRTVLASTESVRLRRERPGADDVEVLPAEADACELSPAAAGDRDLRVGRELLSCDDVALAPPSCEELGAESPVSACATPEPAANTAPTPSVSAPAPNQAYG